MLDARAAAIDWAARSLAHELDEPPPLCEERAESLVAIAEHYGIADDVLIAWIHTTADGKEWSAAEFRAWCETVQREQRLHTLGIVRARSEADESDESWESSRALSELRNREQKETSC